MDSFTLRTIAELLSDPQQDADTLRDAIRALLDSITHVEYGELVVSVEALAFRLGAIASR